MLSPIAPDYASLPTVISHIIGHFANQFRRIANTMKKSGMKNKNGKRLVNINVFIISGICGNLNVLYVVLYVVTTLKQRILALTV